MAAGPGRISKLFLIGDWKVPRTRRLESLRYVARTFLSAGLGDFPVARRSQEKEEWWQCQGRVAQMERSAGVPPAAARID